MREGGQYFTAPAGAAQRRYEALRAYFLDDMPAAEVADRFGYSTASVHQMATLLRKGKLSLFAETKPGPKGPRKVTGQVRDPGAGAARRRAQRHRDRRRAGRPRACRSRRRPSGRSWTPRASLGWPAATRAAAGHRPGWTRSRPRRCPAGRPSRRPCRAITPGCCCWSRPSPQLRLPELVASAGYPATSALSAWQSIGTLLLAKCARRPRIHHVDSLTDDQGLAFTAGPDRPARRPPTWAPTPGGSAASPTGGCCPVWSPRLRRLGLATGAAGFNCDFHAIRHHGDDAALEKHYVPRRSQRTRAVLTFFAQDHASTEMVYANADLTKAEQAREIIAFADYWRQATGADPGLLVFDSQLTTYKILDELTGRGITWLTLRQRGKTELARLAALPATAWTHRHASTASGRYRRPRLHEDMINLNGIAPRSARSPCATSAATSPPC